MALQDSARTTAAGVSLPQRVRLSYSGHWAELAVDDITETGVVLSTGPELGQLAEQSHVETADPAFLLHDYTYRMSAVLRTVTSHCQPRATNGQFTPESRGSEPSEWSESANRRSGGLSADAREMRPEEAVRPQPVLHLGAGALTLPRWIEDHWPGAEQTVVDIEPELVDFVLEHLPMRTPPENIVGDAAGVLGASGALAGRRFGCVVVDLFNSADAPKELTSAGFYEQVLASLTPGGLLLVNLGDDDGMSFARRLVGRLLAVTERSAEDAARPAAGADAGARISAPGCGTDRFAAHALLTAPDVVLSGGQEGNLVFAARPAAPFVEEEVQRIWAAGPHPGDVLTGRELRDWAHRA